MTSKHFTEELPDIPLEAIMEAINVLSSECRIELLRSNDVMAYRVIDNLEAEKLRLMDQDEKMVYQLIKASGSNGKLVQ